MNKDELKGIAGKYLNGNASEREIKMIEAWILLSEKQDASLSEQEGAEVKNRIWKLIDPAIDADERPAAPVLRRFSKRMMRYAAALLLLTGISSAAWFYRYQLLDLVDPIALQQQQSGPFEIKELLLPDSTMVTLAAGSRISYPSRYRGSRRFASLSGKAFFRVTHDPAKPFVVESDSLQIRVLGTSFEVDNATGNDHAKVTVVTGKVQVTAADQPAALLTRNQQLVYNKKEKTISVEQDLDAAAFTGWTSKTLSFNETPVATVLQAIADSWDLEIIPDKHVLGSRATFSGNFAKKENWKDVLDIICMSTGLSWSVTKTNAIVVRK